jgi:hypothetical protein
MVDLWMKNHQKSISHPFDLGFVDEKSTKIDISSSDGGFADEKPSKINISCLRSWICG